EAANGCSNDCTKVTVGSPRQVSRLSLLFVRDDFVRVFSRRNVEPTREFTHGSCPGLVVCCWRMPNTTPGITGPTRRGADRFRGCPHLYAPSCNPSMNVS